MIDSPTKPKTVGKFSHIRRALVGLFLIVVLLGAVTIGWLGYRAAAALTRISVPPVERADEGLFSFLNKQPDKTLKGETDGRINFLILGMGGKGHPGGQLTDTIMLASFLPKEKKIGLMSIPRDLYVPLPSKGWGKLNSVHAFGEQNTTGMGPAWVQETIGEVLGLTVHYYVRVDFDGFINLVDALDGLDIMVETAIYDPFYPADNMVDYDPFYLKAGQTHMDGELALKYARSRETTSDFDRSKRQQNVLKAVKDRALSLNILANPAQIVELMEIAGAHVRTDLAMWEIERLIEIGKSIDTSNIVSKVLDTANTGPLVSRTDEQAGYIIVPRKGNFSELQTLAKNMFKENVEADRATISISNSSEVAGLGGNVALILRGYGYQVTQIDENAKVREKSSLFVKDLTLFPETSEFLSERFSVRAEVSALQEVDFRLTLGKDYAE